MTDNSNTELVVAFSTAGSPEEARRIATALVAEQLAACVNIIDNIHSIYRWQGAIESAAESLMLIKTRANLLPAIELRLRELHSYDVTARSRERQGRAVKRIFQASGKEKTTTLVHSVCMAHRVRGYNFAGRELAECYTKRRV